MQHGNPANHQMQKPKDTEIRNSKAGSFTFSEGAARVPRTDIRIRVSGFPTIENKPHLCQQFQQMLGENLYRLSRRFHYDSKSGIVGFSFVFGYLPRNHFF